MKNNKNSKIDLTHNKGSNISGRMKQRAYDGEGKQSA